VSATALVNIPILVVVGPTGVGKTQVALELAERRNGELVGADSVQVYRGFDIGASKPTPEELRGVPHHLIDIREPEDTLDAASFAELADAAISDIARRGRLPIVVGGTGLWIRALLRGLVEAPKVDPALRARLEADWDREGAIAMHHRLTQIDPLSAQRVHLNDRLRVVRALEVHAQSGQALGQLRADHALGKPRYEDHTILLDLDPVHHAECIRARTRGMLERGLIAEVERIVQRHGANIRALQAVGYKQVLQHLQTPVSLPELEAQINRATLLYARRQRTWWKNDPGIKERRGVGVESP
jgi:tRNA dimethylallyltransferase